MWMWVYIILCICDPPCEKLPLGAILNYSVWCKKVNLRENQFFAQSNYGIYKLPFDTKLVVLLLVVPEIEAPRSSGHFSPQSSWHGSTTEVNKVWLSRWSNLTYDTTHTIIVSPVTCLKLLGIRTAKQNSKKNTQKTCKSHLVYVTQR